MWRESENWWWIFHFFSKNGQFIDCATFTSIKSNFRAFLSSLKHQFHYFIVKSVMCVIYFESLLTIFCKETRTRLHNARLRVEISDERLVRAIRRQTVVKHSETHNTQQQAKSNEIVKPRILCVQQCSVILSRRWKSCFSLLLVMLWLLQYQKSRCRRSERQQNLHNNNKDQRERERERKEH